MRAHTLSPNICTNYSQLPTTCSVSPYEAAKALDGFIPVIRPYNGWTIGTKNTYTTIRDHILNQPNVAQPIMFSYNTLESSLGWTNNPRIGNYKFSILKHTMLILHNVSRNWAFDATEIGKVIGEKVISGDLQFPRGMM